MPDAVIAMPARGARGRSAPGFHCQYLWDSLTILSDGKVTCGFDDPFGTRGYGNIATSSIRDIFNGPAVRALRERLLAGKRCATCHLYAPAPHGEAGLPAIPEMPRRLIVESTIRCNLRCRNTSCDLNNDRGFKVREQGFLAFELFRKLMDEAAPHLGTLYFFNYGEPFLHPRAVDMLAYAKARNPAIAIATSTNGLMLARGDTARRLVEQDLLHWINFTIAGADDPTYQIYHKGGSFEQAFEGMRRVIEEKRRLGRSLPTVRWRYLLFNWNDSDEQIARARALAAEAGVDEFTFFLCSAPLEGRTRLRAPGTPGFRAIADAIDYEVHYQADAFADAGLYPPEHDERLGAFCWTSRKAIVRVRPAAGRAHVLLCRAGAAAAVPVAVRLRTPWQELEARVGLNDWEVTELALPKAARGEAFDVEIVADEAFIPFRHGVRDDMRELGVMVSLSSGDGPSAPAAFATLTHVPAAVPVESREVRLDGLAAAAPVWVRHGEYAVGDGEFTTQAGWVHEGDVVRVRHLSAGAPGLGTTTLLGIGGALANFTSVTAPWAPVAGEPAQAAPAGAQAAEDPEPVREDAALFAARMYRRVLFRAADAQGFAFWKRFLRDGGERADMLEALLLSAEFDREVAPAVRLVLAGLRRAPDAAALRFWIERFRGGEAAAQIAREIAQGAEFAARYGRTGDGEFLDQLCGDLLGREARPEERARWPGGRPGPGERWEALLECSGSEEFRARSANRVMVAMGYLALLERAPDGPGLVYWRDYLDGGGARRDFFGALLGSADYARLAGARERALAALPA